jgi:hypothetical protein
MGQLNGVTSRVDSLTHICESGPSCRFRCDRLLLDCGYGVEAAGAIENRSAQKAAPWVETPVPFRDAFATDAGGRWLEVVVCPRLGRRWRRRQTLLRDP